ncbi:elongation factor Ts, mitochondrial [Hydra vulgaris]|uniref:Elongation factor Ts, mitochondrial n=1 Tax=Hydra vulgaris TaxID=6087 RepID=A0ABM4BF57_HYDVU
MNFIKTKLTKVVQLGKNALYSTDTQKGLINKNLLTKLRKDTGYSFVKCNEALTRFNYDTIKAEEWLHDQAKKEGWNKAQKLSSRSTEQGLVGVLAEKNFVALVDIGCETDFVSRNELFQNFVAATARLTLKLRKNVVLQNMNRSSLESQVGHLKEEIIKHHLLGSIEENSNLKLEELMTNMVGKIGENIVLRRAIAMSTFSSNVIGTAVHGNVTGAVNDCLMGTYAAVVTLRPKSSCDVERASFFAKGIAQHVIGMNPKSISSCSGISEDESLLGQDFLLNDKLTVRSLLEKENLEVIDFMRYALNDNK